MARFGGVRQDTLDGSHPRLQGPQAEHSAAPDCLTASALLRRPGQRLKAGVDMTSDVKSWGTKFSRCVLHVDVLLVTRSIGSGGASMIRRLSLLQIRGLGTT